MNRQSTDNAAWLRRFYPATAERAAAGAGNGLVLAAIGLFLAACQPDTAPPLPSDICSLALPRIGQLQGQGERSPLAGQEVTVRAVVTAVQPGEGFFIHDPEGDTDPGTSEGLWVADAETPFPGELWAWRGTLEERPAAAGPLTTLSQISGRKKCANHVTLPVAELKLPSSQREALESMRVRLPAGLQVAQPPTRYRPYEIRVSTERLFAPTEMVRPGPAAAALARRFAAASMTVDLPPGRHVYRGGDRLEAVVGVYDLRDRPRLLSDSAPAVSQAQGIPPAPPATGEIRIVNMNLQNYYNGDGQGGGFPTARGADSAAAFERQQQRIVAAIHALDPAILAVQELENDGYGNTSAIASLADALNQPQDRSQVMEPAAAPWQFIDPHAASGSDEPQRQERQHTDGQGHNRLGNDSITVGLLYRADRVQPIAAATYLSDGIFAQHHRPLLGQQFALGDNGPSLFVATVHLKSKGSCPETGDNADQQDGQGCWSPAREQATRFLGEWLRHQAAGGGALVLGDFNSYRMEDPIRALIRAGLVELVGHSSAPPLYSYNYRGGLGTLDYAFATPDVLPRLGRALHWHVNADATDPPANDGAAWRRYSDHDPVVVDLRVATH